MADDEKDILERARKVFALAQDAESDNRRSYEEDVEFSRLEKQWPEDIRSQREAKQKPCMTISKMNAFIRQVVNDARMSKPEIKAMPADSGADPDTAEVISGLIRNIEYTSNADVAYDNGIECAVAGGWGYWRIGLDYAYHDAFDMDLSVQRVANPLSVYGDPFSTAADSSDWNDAFVVDLLSKEQFEGKYGKSRTMTDWEDDSWGAEGWRVGNDVTVAEYWRRTEIKVKVSQFLNRINGQMQTYSDADLEKEEDLQAMLTTDMLEFKRSRVANSHKVMQRFVTGAEVLEEHDWPGCYIPIVPVYGDEMNFKGKRYFRSLIHSAKDAQRQFNYWRSLATELGALAPKVPWIGRKGTFDSDVERWQTANTESHAYLEFDTEQPTRIQLDSGPAAGAIQEAMNASDDMKAVMGLYDASLGARSNETSGRAILARQQQGNIATFHFIDNRDRAIRHTGRILLDLIPSVYSGERLIRVMGIDGTAENKPLNKAYPKTDPKTGEPMRDKMGQVIMAMHDLSAGKYDLVVKSGPSFATQREEAAYHMTEMMRAMPASAMILGKHLAKNLDWPGADEIAEELEAMSSQKLPPEVEKLIEEGKQEIARLGEENQKLKSDTSIDQAKLQADIMRAQVEAQNKVRIAMADIEAEKQIARAKIEADMQIQAYRAELQAAATAARPVVNRGTINAS